MAKPQIRFHTRREFLKSGLAMVAATATVPTFLSRTFLALAAPVADTAARRTDERVLVVIQLSGGNDGLNTVVPYTDDHYYRARPKLAVPPDKVLRLNDTIGLHPTLSPLKALYDDGALAVLQGIGYPNPDRSHFRSMEIWQSGVAEDFSTDGWIGRLFDHACSNRHLPKPPCSPTLGVSVDATLNPAMKGSSAIGIALNDPERFYRMTRLHARSSARRPTATAFDVEESPLDFLRRTAMNAQLSADRIRDAVRGVRHSVEYPQNPFARSLELIAGLIAGGMDTKVYYTSLTGFDTHANQRGAHARLLKMLADGIAAFQTDLAALGQADRVVAFTFSEFGRRVAENGSGGTDHGQAAPLFVFGAPVKPGVIGKHPSLGRLNRGDLAFHTDFRRVYATLIDQWLGINSGPVLKQEFERLPFLA